MKRITGSWLDLTHQNELEGKYYNNEVHAFNDSKWRTLIDNMHEFGIKYIVLMQVANTDEFTNITETYYDSKIYIKSNLLDCNNPLEAIFDEADKLDMKIFVSIGYFGYWVNVYENMTNENIFNKSIEGIKEIYNIYGHHKSFYGWYYPDETEISYHFDEFFIDYCNKYSKFIHILNKNHKILIAPYGTCKLSADSEYVDQLKRLDVDFVAYQDEVGVRKTDEYHTREFYKNLKLAHDKAGRSKIWADIEVFEFEGEVYKSALIPAKIDRIERQIKAIEEYVDEILIYEYQCSFNKPNTIAKCGYDGVEELYTSYMELINKENTKLKL